MNKNTPENGGARRTWVNTMESYLFSSLKVQFGVVMSASVLIPAFAPTRRCGLIDALQYPQARWLGALGTQKAPV